MTQTAPPPTTAATAAVASATPPPEKSGTVLPDRPATPAARLAGTVRNTFSGSPGQLRLLAGLAILAALIAAVGGGFAARERAQALDDAQAAANNVVLIQGVRTALVQADANATNASLRGGLEPVAQRTEYTDSIVAASRGLATAARDGAGGDAGDALADVNEDVTAYTGLVEAARANNRQGLQVGASYLRTASESMRDQIVPALDEISEAGAAEVDAAYDRAGRATLWLVLATVLGLGGLIAVQVQLAKRSRRVLSLPVALGTLALAVTLVAVAVVMATAQSQADEVRGGAYARADALGRARVAAFDAKSIEALTLINRGSAQEEDPDWTAAMGQATSALGRDDSGVRAGLDAYAKSHAEILKLDLAGTTYNEAVKASISTAPGSANANFQQFAGDSEQALTTAAASTSDGLDAAGSGLFLIGLAVLLVGLLAAVGAWWGVSLRLEEYR